MAVFKCKMCGGELNIIEGATVCECEYCGTKQTVPTVKDENLQGVYNRANTLRIKSEFDKAEKLYEKIVQADETQAEAYWGMILCRNGIEYVEDPVTFKRIPTCHRASFDSIVADEDYKSAIKYADGVQKAIYEAEAKEIDRIQKEIIELSQKEEPYDVFICYKETDAEGKRTQDSVIANDIYYQLTNEGFKVFYAAITLEEKLGSAYEPCIFAALNSAKVMLSIGTKPEYFNAVWVKNEWSRYLKIMKKDRTKLLIPCYRDMDAYDLPEEFSHLQAQDMSKIGFINDVVRGIKKVIKTDESEGAPVKATVISDGNTNTAPLLERAFMFLEDGDFERADDFCEQVLNQNPKCAEAYLGKLMVALRVKKRESLKDQSELFDSNNYFQKALRFADEKLKKELQSNIDCIVERNLNCAYGSALSQMKLSFKEHEFEATAELFEKLGDFKDSQELAEKCLMKAKEARLTTIYNDALSAMNSAQTEQEYKASAEKFGTIKSFKDSDDKARVCLEKAETARKDAIYVLACNSMKVDFIEGLESAINKFEVIIDWRDSADKIEICKNKIEEIKVREEAERLEKERKAEQLRIEAEKRKKLIRKVIIVVTPILCAIIVFIIVLITVIIPNNKYRNAIALMNEEKYSEAKAEFESLNGYKDSVDKIEECNIGVYGEKLWNKIKNIKVGTVFEFGAYEQDNNTQNGKEEIEWIVLEKEGTKVLLISKYGLDCKPYNTTWLENITWENCTLCEWLNNDFMNSAFSIKEQGSIFNEIFIFDSYDVECYLVSESERKCVATDYAINNGGTVSLENYVCNWWLSDEGSNGRASLVMRSGDIDLISRDVNSPAVCVRPAMWIDIS